MNARPSKTLPNSRQFLRQFWLPLLCIIVLIAACLPGILPGHAAHRLGDIGTKIIYNALIVLSIALLWRQARKTASARPMWWLLDASLCNLLFGHALKFGFHLPRPSGSPTGFPSTHTSFVFALSALVLQIEPRLAPLWFGAAVWVGWSRVELHAHFPYQVGIGALLGLLLGVAVTRIPNGILLPRLFNALRSPVPRSATEPIVP